MLHTLEIANVACQLDKQGAARCTTGRLTKLFVPDRPGLLQDNQRSNRHSDRREERAPGHSSEGKFCTGHADVQCNVQWMEFASYR